MVEKHEAAATEGGVKELLDEFARTGEERFAKQAAEAGLPWVPARIEAIREFRRFSERDAGEAAKIEAELRAAGAFPFDGRGGGGEEAAAPGSVPGPDAGVEAPKVDAGVVPPT